MNKPLKIIQRAGPQVSKRRSAATTDAQLRLEAARMTKEIEEKARRRERGELTPQEDVEVIIEWR